MNLNRLFSYNKESKKILEQHLLRKRELPEIISVNSDEEEKEVWANARSKNIIVIIHFA